MKKLFYFSVILLALGGCKENEKDAKKEPAKPEATQKVAAFPELGPCYKFDKCPAESEINYGGISKSECGTKGGKSWKGMNSGCQSL